MVEPQAAPDEAAQAADPPAVPDGLDAQPEEQFERLTAIAARLLETRFAAIVLREEERVWCGSALGDDRSDLRNVFADTSLIGSSQNGPVVHSDLCADPATAGHPIASLEGGQRFWAGAPLLTNGGRPVGVLAVCDPEPREPSERQLELLAALAGLVGLVLESRQKNRMLSRLTESVGELVEGAAVGERDEFYRWMVRHLRKSLQVDLAVVGELVGEDGKTFRSLAVESAHGEAPPLDYLLDGKPCARVIEECGWSVPSGLRELYPENEVVVAFGADSYAGVELRDSSKRAIGIVWVLSRNALVDPDLVRATLSLFAARASHEIERQRAWEQLQLIVEGTASKTGDDFFRSLTEHLARALQVRVASVCERDLDSERARTLALWKDGAFLDNFEFDLGGRPSALVYRSSIYFRQNDVRRHFPEDEWLADLEAESYVGIALRDSNGTPIGHMAVVHDKPLAERNFTESYFKIFAARAGAELERQKNERRRLAMERALAEAQKLESLGTLAGGVAHDFNNLLVGIMGYASLALAQSDETAVRHNLEEIQTAARRAADLARQMLAYSGREPFLVEPVDMSGLVREIRELLSASIPRKVTILDDLEEGLPAVVCDATQIRQVVMNLVLNATEAARGLPGTVRLRTGQLELTSAELEQARVGKSASPGLFVFVEVSDDGAGIDDTTLARIFDPYYTTKAGGRGLGLATVQGIVRGHDGALRVFSEHGRGSTFQVLLPAASGQVSAIERRTEETVTPWRGSGTVLLVDDESAVREVTHRLLENLGFKVIAAAGGAEGIDRFAENRDAIDLVLLDMTMPGLDGSDALRAIRHVDPDACVVLMSGYTERETMRGLAGLVPSGFLQKPFGTRELSSLLQESLAGHRA